MPIWRWKYQMINFHGKNIDICHVGNPTPINFHRYYTPFGLMSALIDRLLMSNYDSTVEENSIGKYIDATVN